MTQLEMTQAQDTTGTYKLIGWKDSDGSLYAELIIEGKLMLSAPYRWVSGEQNPRPSNIPYKEWEIFERLFAIALETHEKDAAVSIETGRA